MGDIHGRITYSREDVERIKAASFHEHMPAKEAAPAIEIEHINDGFSDQFKTEHYRLAIIDEFLYLTDRHTSHCTCHGKGIQSIKELIALLQRAQQKIEGGK